MQKITFFILLLVTVSGFSQKYELGNVTIEELEQNVHPKDTTAVAAVLFKKGDVSLGRIGFSNNTFLMETKVKYKIKIYKKEGHEFANHQFLYYVGGIENQSVEISKACTYNLVNGKIEKTKLTSEGEFDEKINKSLRIKKIAMPNVKDGSIIEFECLITSPGIGIADWEFQAAIPVNHSEFVTNIPEYFVYNINMKGSFDPVILKQDESRKLTDYIRNNVEYICHKTTYRCKDLPAIKDEAYVNNIKNYLSSISHELSLIKFPNTPYKPLSTDWQTVTKNIYENEGFGSELNKTGYFEDELKVLLSAAETPDAKIAAIFQFVKTKVKWNDYYGYVCDEGVKKAYKDKTGNVAEINLMLTAMLRYAGFNANPVLISTRSNGIPIFPNRTAYNYVIAAVEKGGDIILLDATSKNAVPNILPTRDLNWIGRMIRKDGTSAEIDLMPKMVSKVVISLIATIGKDGTIQGKLKEQYSDYNAFQFRSTHADLSNDSHLERLEKRYKGIEVEAYEMENASELDKPLVESYTFKDANNVEIIGDKMYFSPMLFFALSENPFKQDKREYPIDFSYPNQDKYIMNITIPEGYAVETLPQSGIIPMSDNAASLKYVIAKTDNKIQLSMTFDINVSILPADYYPELKAFFAEVVKKQTERVVLKKV